MGLGGGQERRGEEGGSCPGSTVARLGLGVPCSSRGGCILFAAWDLVLRSPERKVGAMRGHLASQGGCGGERMPGGRARGALRLGTAQLGQGLALPFPSLPSSCRSSPAGWGSWLSFPFRGLQD